MKRIFLFIAFHSSFLALTAASRPCLDSDYSDLTLITRSVDPEAKILIANLMNIVTNSVYAAAEEDKNAQMQSVTSVLNSVGTVIQLLINKSNSRHNSFMQADEIMELLNRPLIKQLLLQRLRIERHFLLQALRKISLTHRA